MTDCKAVFENTISQILGTETELTTAEWKDLNELIDRWVNTMESIGASPDDPIYIDQLKAADIPFLPSEKRADKVKTMLDAFLEMYTQQMVHIEADSMLRKYRQEQSFRNLTQLVDQARDGVIERSKKVRDPGVASAIGLRDILASAGDNTKQWLTLEDRINANFNTYFHQHLVRQLEKKLPNENYSKLLNDEKFVGDVAEELFRSSAEIADKTYRTQNTRAQVVAEALIDTNGALITELNRKGANMQIKANDLMPTLNWVRIKKWAKGKPDARAAFVDFMAPRLSDAYGELAGKRNRADAIYESMEKHNGFIEWTEIDPERFNPDTASEPLIEFKDGAGWMEVNKAFGERNMWTTVVGQQRFLAKQLALTEMFGPQWRTNWNRIGKYVATNETGGQTSGGSERIEQSNEYRAAQNTFDRLTVSQRTPHDLTVNAGLKAARNLTVANSLGSAVLTAMMDPTIAATTVSRLYGISFFRNIDQQIAGFTSAEAKQYARTLGTAVESMMGAMQDRFILFDDWNSMNNIQRGSAKAAEMVMKWSGMEYWTDSMKAGVTSVIRTGIGDMVADGNKWADLNPKFRKSLERFDITDAEWNTITKAQLDANGRLDVFEISNKDLRFKVTAWFADAVNTAVITPNLRDIEWTAAFQRPGSKFEEIMKTVLQFKQFPIAFTRKFLGRAYKDRESNLDFIVTMGAYTAMATLMGSVVTQLKQVVAGKQPYNIDDAKLWTDALILASPVGIMQDVFMQAGGENLSLMLFGEKPNYNDAFSAVVGPFFSDLAKMGSAMTEIVGSAPAAIGIVDADFDAEQKLTKGTSKLTQWALRQVPGQNLWYARAVYELAFMDALHEMMDPDGYRRRQNNLLKDADKRVGGNVYNAYGEQLQTLRD